MATKGGIALRAPAGHHSQPQQQQQQQHGAASAGQRLASPLRVVFSDSPAPHADDGADDGDSSPRCRRGTRRCGAPSASTTVLLLAAVAFCMYEFTKVNSCYVTESDLAWRDKAAMMESVCTDPLKVVQFGHRFSEGCIEATQNTKQGIIHGMYTCFIAKHKIYTFMSFDNVYVNAALVLVVLYSLTLVKDYCVQVSVAAEHGSMLRAAAATGGAYAAKAGGGGGPAYGKCASNVRAECKSGGGGKRDALAAKHRRTTARPR